jgi:hypothetical protein
MDSRTAKYLNELARALEYNDKNVAIGAAEQLCTCHKCVGSRANKGLSDCDKVLGLPLPGNYIPELSPNYFLYQSGKRRSF